MPVVTDLTPADYAGDWIMLDDPADKRLANIGITLLGQQTSVWVRSVSRSLGKMVINNIHSKPLAVVLENSAWLGRLHVNLRVHESGCIVVFNLAGVGIINLADVFLRSPDQSVFWGAGATAVGCPVFEIEGHGRSVAIGDDALLSSGVTLRNFDMHAIVDLTTMKKLNSPVDTYIEQHVWLGQDVLVLGCERIGFGSIIGAKSIVKGRIPPTVIAAGTPAKVIVKDRSWGRKADGITLSEIQVLKRLSLAEEPL